MINVVHITENPIAGAPLNLYRALNKYQGDKVQCRHIANSDRNGGRVYGSDLLTTTSPPAEIRQVMEEADILHFHNFYRKQELFTKWPSLWNVALSKPRVWQVHSPRDTNWVDLEEGLKDKRAKHLVIGQYHPRQWPECEVVPNVIDIWDPKLMPIERDWNGPPRVVYSPSRIGLTGWDDKGYSATAPVLQTLVNEGRITAEIIYEKPYDECLQKRSMAHIGIDEIITGSYHLCSLEALSAGLCTIAGLDEIQIATLKDLTGATTLPWFITRPATFETSLRELAKKSFTVRHYAQEGRAWMEKFWNPADITNRFVKIYESL